jgi:hypothetical protein
MTEETPKDLLFIDICERLSEELFSDVQGLTDKVKSEDRTIVALEAAAATYARMAIAVCMDSKDMHEFLDRVYNSIGGRDDMPSH